MKINGKKIRVFTWNIHGSYLYYLSQTNCLFYVPYNDSGEKEYGRLGDNFEWGKNLIQVPVSEVKRIDFDCILFQSRQAYLNDQFKIFTDNQRQLPKIYLEHDPPREHPTDTVHFVGDKNIPIINVTDFNQLMWDTGDRSAVIEHGVFLHSKKYTGNLQKGIVVINNLQLRGRRLGLDIFEKVRKQIPLDIIGIDSENLGGLGEIKHKDLGAFLGRYRFYFNPIRYTSLGLSLCEAMHCGLPVVTPATTEVATVIKNGINGFSSNNIQVLVARMKDLLQNPILAKKMGKEAQKTALRRFNIKRFAQDWERTFQDSVSKRNLQFLSQTL